MREGGVATLRAGTQMEPREERGECIYKVSNENPPESSVYQPCFYHTRPEELQRPFSRPSAPKPHRLPTC